MSKVIMSGNEAVARGAWEGGVTVAAAYPGTPSTEILENVALYKDDIYCEWAPNEAVAAEVGLGAAVGGARSMVTFKHVGMNVATDPIFVAGYTGVNGGLVFVDADDPGCHSSQNEQDNRWYAPHAKLAMLEPSDSQECKDFMRDAFALSEKYDTAVLLRMTTRVCHSKSLVELGDRSGADVKPYVYNKEKYSLLPANALKRHPIVEDNLRRLAEDAETLPFNKVEDNGSDTGVITSGISYQYVKEVFGDSVNILKLGLTYPFPEKLISDFASKQKTLYIVEENDPFLETEVKALGFKCVGKDKIPGCGELNAAVVKEALTGVKDPSVYEIAGEVPSRPPMLCAGCPHRGFFDVISRSHKRLVLAGDIGCYGLGTYDYSFCMGAGFSSTVGMAKALELQGDKRKVLGMVGDSTFFHSGVNGLFDIFSTQVNVIACVLDNSITAMTGHQDNPGTTKNLMGEDKPAISIEAVVRAIGFTDENIRVVDPLDIKAMQAALNDGINHTGPFVIITKRPCALIREVRKANAGKFYKVDTEKCTGCKVCIGVTCPALSFENGAAKIDPAQCTGCGLCAQKCHFGAIIKGGEF